MRMPYRSSHPKRSLTFPIYRAASSKFKDSKFGNWSSLPTDLLLVIMGLLPSRDCFRCGIVCLSWNRAITKEFDSPARSLWSMINPNSNANNLTRIMLNPFTKKEEHKIQLPTHRSFLGSTSDGYMIFDQKSELLVKNPLTGLHIPFPSITILPKARWGRITSAALLHGPAATAAREEAVAAITFNCGLDTRLAFSRSQNKRWTLLGVPVSLGPKGVLDIKFHKGLLYVLTKNYGTMIWDIGGKQAPQMSTLAAIGNTNFYVRSKFLVESFTGGDLYKVHTDIWNKEYNVFKLEASGAGTDTKWCRVNSLSGDDALMLSPKRAVCVSAEEFPELRSNCIYSILSTYPDNALLVYSLSDGRKEYIPLEDGMDDWFTPCLSK